MRVYTAGIGQCNQRCDSCLKPILIGMKYQRIRAKLPKPRTRQAAMTRLNTLPLYSARHIDCPKPELQVMCPKCLALPGNPCIFFTPFKVDVSKTLNQPHKARVNEWRNNRYG